MNINKRDNLNNVDELMLNYIKILLDKKGMSDLPTNILASMTLDLYNRLEAFLFTSILNILDPMKYEEFDRYFEKEQSSEKALAFFRKNIPDFNDKIRGVMSEFEGIYLSK